MYSSEECYRGVPWYSGRARGAGTGKSLGWRKVRKGFPEKVKMVQVAVE